MSKFKLIEKGMLFLVLGLFSLLITYGLNESFQSIFQEDPGNPGDQLGIISMYYISLCLGIGFIIMALSCFYKRVIT